LKQDEILNRRQKLKARLDTRLTASAIPRSASVRLDVTNEGNRSASNFYWHIFVPAAAVKQIEPGSGGERVGLIEVLGSAHFLCRGFVREPVYPGRTYSFEALKLKDVVQNEFAVLVRLVAEDGEFPAKDDFFTIKVSL
jgi:hypothetical protein